MTDGTKTQGRKGATEQKIKEMPDFPVAVSERLGW